MGFPVGAENHSSRFREGGPLAAEGDWVKGERGGLVKVVQRVVVHVGPRASWLDSLLPRFPALSQWVERHLAKPLQAPQQTTWRRPNGLDKISVVE